MVPFEEFRLSHRNARRHYRRTRLTGLIPVAVMLSLAGSIPYALRPGLWGALGVVIGFDLVLWGAYRLHSTLDRRSRLGEMMEARLHTGFPFLIFIVQHVHIISVLIVLWFTVQALGIPISSWQNRMLILLILLIPLKRILRELAHQKSSLRLESVSDALSYPISILSILMVSTGLTAFFSPGYELIREEGRGPFLFIWVPTIVIVLICAVLFAERLRRLPKEP